jgi:hypothetical protein
MQQTKTLGRGTSQRNCNMAGIDIDIAVGGSACAWVRV